MNTPSTLAFIGDQMPPQGYYSVCNNVIMIIQEAAYRGGWLIMTGVSSPFEQFCAQAVIAHREQGLPIKLIVMISQFDGAVTNTYEDRYYDFFIGGEIPRSEKKRIEENRKYLNRRNLLIKQADEQIILPNVPGTPAEDRNQYFIELSSMIFYYQNPSFDNQWAKDLSGQMKSQPHKRAYDLDDLVPLWLSTMWNRK